MRSGPGLLCAAALVLAACGAAATTGDDAGTAPTAAAEGSTRVERQGDQQARAEPSDTAPPDGDGGGDGAADPGPATPTPTPPPGPATPTPTPTPDATQAAGPRPATSADAAAFLAQVEPDGVRDVSGVAVDLDDDGTHELVLSGIRDGRGWLGLAAWDGRAYRIVAQDRGGPGERVVQVSVADVNGDGVREAVLEVGGDGAGSLALWRVPPRVALVPLHARGGCHAGSHVYGAVGARLVRGAQDGVLDVAATCDDSPLPRADWSTQRWVWDGSAYVHVPDRPGRGNGSGPPAGTPRGGPDAQGD